MTLNAFVKESNRIEGILRMPTDKEIAAHVHLLQDVPTIESLSSFVAAIQPDAELRNKQGLDVRVGPHIPPPGGPEIEVALDELLMEATHGVPKPYETHIKYETLHPFTDGNGRSGRALWLWQMSRLRDEFPPLGFLHTFYYQSLDGARAEPLDSDGESSWIAGQAK